MLHQSPAFLDNYAHFKKYVLMKRIIRGEFCVLTKAERKLSYSRRTSHWQARLPQTETVSMVMKFRAGHFALPVS